jgi:branched-chain amino acid transport system permease protein
MLALQLVVNGILLGGMYVLMAQSLNLVFGVMGVVNLAHGTFITTAGLFTFWLATYTHVNALVALPVVFGGMLVIGAAVERLLLEPVAGTGRRAELLSLMVTFGLSYVLIQLTLHVWGSQFVSLPDLQATWSLGGVTFSEALVVAGVFAAVISGLLHVWLNRTASGKALLAASQSHIGAATCGIDVRRMRLVSFAVGSALAAVAGVLLILVLPLAAQSADTLTILAFVIVALGGLGDYRGAAIAAVLLGIVQSIAGYYFGGDVETVLPYVLLIVVMIVRPQGFGRALAGAR